MTGKHSKHQSSSSNGKFMGRRLRRRRKQETTRRRHCLSCNWKLSDYPLTTSTHNTISATLITSMAPITCRYSRNDSINYIRRRLIVSSWLIKHVLLNSQRCRISFVWGTPVINQSCRLAGFSLFNPHSVRFSPSLGHCIEFIHHYHEWGWLPKGLPFYALSKARPFLRANRPAN